MLPLSIGILTFSLLADPYSAFFNLHVEGPFSRFLLSIPFLFLGFLYSQNITKIALNTTTGAVISLFGLLLQFAESYLIFKRSQHNLFQHEFLLGTFILAIGIFFLSQSININKDTFVSKIGREHSLLIYLYHPLVIVVVFFLIKKLQLQNSNYLVWFNPITIFGFTLLVVKAIESKFPFLLRFISGKA